MQDSLPPPPTGTPKVLLVGPNGEGRDRLKRQIDAVGYQVDTCRPEQAAIRAREGNPDILVIEANDDARDLAYTLCRTFRSSRHGFAMVLATRELPSEALVVEGLAAGADDFVTESRADELRARLRIQLRHVRARRLLDWAREGRSAYREAAFLDPLTRIGNRRAGERAIDAALAAGCSVAVLLFDLDWFKQVNDAHGHLVGDEVLRRVAGTLAGLVRRGDTIARYGGEEFVAVLTNVPERVADRVADRFRRAVSDMPRADLPVEELTTSIGVSTFAGAGAESETPSRDAMLELADRALYRAKRDGRNRVFLAAGLSDNDPVREGPSTPITNRPPGPAEPAPHE